MKTGFLKVLLLSLCLSVSGCASFLKGSIDSVPDPTYAFDRDAPVMVASVPDSKNSLQSKFYLARVADDLRSRGFKTVFTEGEKGKASRSVSLSVQVDTGRKTSSYTYRSADYGQVPDGGKTTKCVRDEREKNKQTVDCTTTPTTSYAIVGYSDKTVYTTEHVFSVNAFDVKTKQKVLSVVAWSRNSGCPDERIYDFLATQALARMNLSQIVRESFSVELPQGAGCR